MTFIKNHAKPLAILLAVLMVAGIAVGAWAWHASSSTADTEALSKPVSLGAQADLESGHVSIDSIKRGKDHVTVSVTWTNATTRDQSFDETLTIRAGQGKKWLARGDDSSTRTICPVGQACELTFEYGTDKPQDPVKVKVRDTFATSNESVDRTFK